MTTVALTGATGFIGRVLLRQFLDQGYRIRALYRPTSGSPQSPVDGVTWQPGSLEETDSLRALVSDVDLIVHCAGAVRGVNLEQFKAVNVTGVANLLRAASDCSVPRFLLISSLAAREPDLSAYATSKKMGEDILRDHRGSVAWDILRPPAVYGPGDREMLPLLRMIRRGFIPVIGARQARFSLLYVDDLATAVAALLKSPRQESGRCFELHDGHPDGYTWQQIEAYAARLNGKTPRCFSIPKPVMQGAGAINVFLARLFGYRPMLTPGKVREIFHPDWACDNAAITRAIDWQPQVQFSEGMQRLFAPGQ